MELPDSVFAFWLMYGSSDVGVDERAHYHRAIEKGVPQHLDGQLLVDSEWVKQEPGQDFELISFETKRLFCCCSLGLFSGERMDIGELQVPLEGFEDVTPIPQDDGPDPVASIAYRHNCE